MRPGSGAAIAGATVTSSAPIGARRGACMAVSWLRIRPVIVLVCSLLLPMVYLSCTLLAKYAVSGRIQRPGADMDVPKFDRWAGPAHVPRHLPNAGVVTYPPRATLGPRLQPDYQLVLVH